MCRSVLGTTWFLGKLLECPKFMRVTGVISELLQKDMAGLQERAGLAQVVPQAGRWRLLGSFRADPHICA